MRKFSSQVIIAHLLHISLFFLILSIFQVAGGGLDINFWRSLYSLFPIHNIFNHSKVNIQNKTVPIKINHLVYEKLYEKDVLRSVYSYFDNSYGYFGTFILFILRCLSLIALPIMIFQFCGLVFYPAFPDSPKFLGKQNDYKNGNLDLPFICFRVVTRGNFSELVQKNVQRNYNLCKELNFFNFIIQIVTDKAIGFTDQSRYITEISELSRKFHKSSNLSIGKGQVFELVVPDNYQTRRGSLFKARALQFALEDQNHFLNDDDWIVHLDEETLLTRESLIGILNFTYSGTCDFGQGLITYAKDGVVNWLTTLADTFRVADDMGKNRFQLKFLGKPFFNWKGSYVVTRAAAERKVTFDVGLNGSIAEDCYFAMNAIKMHLSLPPSSRLPRPSRFKPNYQVDFQSNPIFRDKGQLPCSSSSSSLNFVHEHHTIQASTSTISLNTNQHHDGTALTSLSCCEFGSTSISKPSHNNSAVRQQRINNTSSTTSFPCERIASIGNNFNFRFDFIEGEMLEKSPFTIMDFLRQRKRWLQGIYLVVHRCPEIPVCSVKLCLAVFVYAWILMPVILVNEVLVTRLWPLNSPRILRVLTAFVSGTTVYMYAFGAVKSFFGGARPLVPFCASFPRCYRYISRFGSSFLLPVLRGRGIRSTKNDRKNGLPIYHKKKSIFSSGSSSSNFSHSSSSAVTTPVACGVPPPYSFLNDTYQVDEIFLSTPQHDSHQNAISDHACTSSGTIMMNDNNVLCNGKTHHHCNGAIFHMEHDETVVNFPNQDGNKFSHGAKKRGLVFPIVPLSLLKKVKRNAKQMLRRFLFVIFCVVGSLAMIPFNVCIETVAVIWGLIGKKHQFYIVSKQID